MIRSPSLRLVSTLLLALALAPVAACGSKLPEPVEPAPAPAPQPIPPPASDAPPPASGPGDKVSAMDQPADLPPPPPAPSALSDEAILHVLQTASVGEIDRAKLARRKAKDAMVKQLASSLDKEHRDAAKKGAALAKQVKLVPTENDLSSELANAGKKDLEEMTKAKGAAFDRAYLASQVKSHEQVLEAFDKKLVPAARNEELKAFLGKLRLRLSEQLDMARKAQADLEKKI